jgi:Sulfotransferase family
MINAERGVIFCHVPKNAGQSIVSALTRAGGYRRAPYQMVEKDPEMRWRNGECRRLREQIPPEQWNGSFKFAFVRNPWDRLVSSWKFTRERGMHDLAFEQFVTALPSLDGQQPLDALERAVSIHWHTMPQTDHLVIEGVLAVDLIGRLESLDRHWQEICGRIGCPAIPLARRNTTVRGDYRSYYSDRTARMAFERFWKDIEMFGYAF